MTDEPTPHERTGRHGPTIRDVARHRRGVDRHGLQGAQRSGTAAQETRDKVTAWRARSATGPTTWRRACTGALDDGGDHLDRLLRPLHPAHPSRRSRSSSPTGGIAIFMCNATDDPERERQHLDQLLGKRIDGLVVTARRADKRPPVGPLPPGLPVVYVFTQADDDTALSLLPDDEGGARLGGQAPGRDRLPPHRPCHRPAALRGGAAAPPRLPGGAGRGRASSADPGHYRLGRLVRGLGPRCGGPPVRRRTPGAAPDGLFCGNDQIARGTLEALRERGIAVPGSGGGRLRQLERHDRVRRGRR
jgi:LacI family transcriptional regulator